MTFPTRAQLEEHRQRSLIALTAIEGITDDLPQNVSASALAQALGSVIGSIEDPKEAEQAERDAIHIIQGLAFAGQMRVMKRDVQRQAEQRLKAQLPRTEDEPIPPALLERERAAEPPRGELWKD